MVFPLAIVGRDRARARSLPFSPVHGRPAGSSPVQLLRVDLLALRVDVVEGTMVGSSDNDARARADQATQTPGSSALSALPQGAGPHRLDVLEAVAAGLAFILIRGH